jgi:hypothetical protein
MLQRRIIPVYMRRPLSDESAKKDKEEVDGFARNAANVPDAAPVITQLFEPGDLRDIKPPEILVLTGHGNVGNLQGYSGAEVARVLKERWHLPKTYDGTLRIDSCKAGDKGGFLNPTSLIEDVSNELQGYQVTVQGLSGNVVTPPKGLAGPGIPRSVADDRAFEEYLRICTVWLKLQDDYDRESAKGPVADARQAARLAEASVVAVETELRGLQPRTPIVGTMISLVAGTRHEVQRITAELETAKKEALTQREIEGNEQTKLNDIYLPLLENALDRLKDFGKPFGDPSVTVTHGPADRAPKPAPTGGQSLVSLWIAYLQETMADPALATGQ